MRIVIFGNPITKKNSFQMARNPKTGRMFPVQSKAYKGYNREALKQAKLQKDAGFKPICTPVNVCCTFYTETRRKVDGLNLCAAIDDILVEAGILLDDNRDIVAGHDGSRVFCDKTNPRVEIEITEMSDYAQWKARKTKE